VRMLAHHALGGPNEPGRAAYQVAMTVCEQCGHGTRDGAGRIFAVEAEEVDAARCDAQVIPRAATGVGRGGAAGVRAGGRTGVESAEVEPEEVECAEVESAEVESEGVESQQVESEEVESAEVESEEVESEEVYTQEVAAPSEPPGKVRRVTHVGRGRGEQGVGAEAADRAAPAEVEARAGRQVGEADADRVIESRHEAPEPIHSTHVGRAAPAASQSIPPRIRREVWRRDHGRCQVPGCRAARFLEVHHILPRALGGPHEPGNLLVMCSAHHARVHGGALRLSGTAPDHLVFQRADGAPYGLEVGMLLPPRTGASRSVGADMGALEADAIGALRRLGIAAGDARAAVAAAARTGPTDIEALLRGALGVLHRGVYAAHVSVIEA
ncbi:MAG TPA: HNH endonuclease signature motif containing protein, partial [Planctomycetota bacterium]|nr:HNH endonuclease signature motif containing protein [Planctomycetota bacterium]